MQLTKQQLDSYERDGFLLLANYFSKPEIDILRAELPAIFAEDTPRRILETSGAVRSVFASHTTNEVLHCFSRLSRLVRPTMQAIGSEVYIHQFKINAKVALEGDEWEWHQDFTYWHKEDGMPEPRTLTAALFLQDVNDFNGPMLLIPGSHKDGMVDVAPHENSTQYEDSRPWMSTLGADLKYKISKDILARYTANSKIIAVKGSAGFVLFFQGNLFHASARNLSPEDRLSIFVSFNSVENTLAEVENPRPEFIANRDFSAIIPLPDDALLKMKNGCSEVGRR